MSGPRLRLVVPDAGDRPTTATLLGLADALGGTVDLDVLCWQSGPLAPAFAAVAPTVDAGTIDQWRPARALQLLGQHRIAQGVKTPRLRALLDDLPPTNVTWLGGLEATPYLAWVPTPETLVVQVDAEATTGPFATDQRALDALAAADLVVVTDASAAAWVAEHGVEDARIERHALLAPTTVAADAADPGPLELVGLFGCGADELAELVTAIALSARGRSVGFRWLSDAAADWALWQGRGGLVAHQVDVVALDPPAAALGGLRVLAHPAAAPPSVELRRLAGILGITLVAVGAVSDAGAAVRSALDDDLEPADWTLTTTEAVSALAPRLAALAAGSAGDATPPAAAPPADH